MRSALGWGPERVTRTPDTFLVADSGTKRIKRHSPPRNSANILIILV